VFELVRGAGGIARGELERTFNLGVGMVAVVPAEAAAPAVQLLAERHVPAWELGRIEPVTTAETGAEGAVRLVSDYAGIAGTWR
jgi:phosphoribosylformylglycinamidine cyclo-ligase